nr:peptidylprolyl isomerase SurA [Sulfuriflexus mobilis]
MRSLILLSTLLAALSVQAAVLPVDRIIAVVNDDVIMESELATRLRTIKGQLEQRKTALPPEDILRKQVLERLILSRLQLQAAERTGVRVSEQQLNAAIARIATQNKMTIAQFRNTLERDGFDFNVFREDIRREMTISQLLQRAVKQRINVTDQEVSNFLATNKNQASGANEFRLSHILIQLPEAASAEQVDAAQRTANATVAKLRSGADFGQVAAASSAGQQAFEGGDLGWRKAAQLPSLFSDVVTSMGKGDISDPIRSPSGFHIVQLTDVRGQDQRHVTKQSLSRHILIRTNELTSDDDARSRLNQLLIRLEGGEDFATLARAHSDDRGSAANGGDLGWTSPGALVPQFEAEMNNLAPGQISQPFRSPFGWHIVQLIDRRTHDDTEQFLKNKAREFLTERKTEEETETWLRRLRDEAYVEYRLEDNF